MKIIIGFSKSRNPWKIGSKIIQTVEKRNYSHVFVKYNDSLTSLDIVAQASNGLVNEMILSVFIDHNIIVKEYELNTTEELYINVVKFLRMNLGKPYSRFQLICIGIKKLFNINLNIHNNDNAFICSELAARICQILNVKISGEIDYISPSDLDFLLEDIYGRR